MSGRQILCRIRKGATVLLLILCTSAAAGVSIALARADIVNCTFKDLT